jgi:hypothetical protein
VLTIWTEPKGVELCLKKERAITGACVDPVIVREIGLPVGDVGPVVGADAPAPVPRDLDLWHLIVRERHDALGGQIRRSDIGPIAVARGRLLLLGLNAIVLPMPDVHIRERQILLRPVFELVILRLRGHKKRRAVRIPN